jgi:protein-export chaperone SecB
VTATVHTKIKDKTVFLVEAKQAGIFEMRNIAEDQMGQIMGIACPQIVYPYLRGNVADLIQRAAFHRCICLKSISRPCMNSNSLPRPRARRPRHAPQVNVTEMVIKPAPIE